MGRLKDEYHDEFIYAFEHEWINAYVPIIRDAKLRRKNAGLSVERSYDDDPRYLWANRKQESELGGIPNVCAPVFEIMDEGRKVWSELRVQLTEPVEQRAISDEDVRSYPDTNFLLRLAKALDCYADNPLLEDESADCVLKDFFENCAPRIHVEWPIPEMPFHHVMVADDSEHAALHELVNRVLNEVGQSRRIAADDARTRIDRLLRQRGVTTTRGLDAPDSTLTVNEDKSFQSQFELDESRLRARVRKVWHDLTDAQFDIIKKLYDANGAWKGGKSLKSERGSRPDIIIKKMPMDIRSLINSDKAKGYRLSPDILGAQQART